MIAVQCARRTSRAKKPQIGRIRMGAMNSSGENIFVTVSFRYCASLYGTIGCFSELGEIMRDVNTLAVDSFEVADLFIEKSLLSTSSRFDSDLSNNKTTNN